MAKGQLRSNKEAKKPKAEKGDDRAGEEAVSAGRTD